MTPQASLERAPVVALAAALQTTDTVLLMNGVEALAEAVASLARDLASLARDHLAHGVDLASPARDHGVALERAARVDLASLARDHGVALERAARDPLIHGTDLEREASHQVEVLPRVANQVEVLQALVDGTATCELDRSEQEESLFQKLCMV